MNNKLEGFVQSLCLQIFNTTVERLLDSDDEAIDDRDLRAREDIVEGSEEESLDTEDIYDI